MPRFRKRLLLASRGAAALALAAAWVGSVTPARAQEISVLRGPVIESEINEVLLPGALEDQNLDRNRTGGTSTFSTFSTSGVQSAYEPASPGALPDGPGTGEEEEDAETANPFSDGFAGQREPAERTLSTARARERQQAERSETQRSPEARASEEDGTEDEALTTGTVGDETTEIAPNQAAERVSERVGAIGDLDRAVEEEDPYAPLGLRVGTFTVVPTLEQGLTWTSNANASPDGDDALFSETTLRLNAESDQAGHFASVDAYGTFRKPLSGDADTELEGGVDALLRLDLADDFAAVATFGYSAAPESASSPVIITGVDEEPLLQTINGSLGLEKDAGRLRLGITGNIERDQYGDATLTDGTVVPQDDRNATLATVVLRGGYELSPALAPFVEVEAGRRFYDHEVDSGGYARSATRLGARAGVAVELGEKLRGEIAAGWISEDFEDDRLETISAPTISSSLAWSPERGTMVRLDAYTTVEGTTDPGDSGSVLYSGRLSVEREIRANLTGLAAFGADWRRYDAGGHELTLAGEAELTWWLNRYAGVTGRVRHERLQSDLPDRDYDETSVFLGMKLQR